jgi:hypothetical protein
MASREPPPPSPGFAPVVDRLVPCDRQHPSLERRLAAKTLQPPVRQQERFLCDIVGIRRRPDRR